MSTSGAAEDARRRAYHGACPLCRTRGTVSSFATTPRRAYLHCSVCALVFAHPDSHLDADAERARYLLHENTRENEGYVTFLTQLADVVMAAVPSGARGLDVGCGRVPLLGEILTAHGFPTASWDPFFLPDPAPLARTYDFVTCCEVAEHAFEPHRLFALLRSCVRSGGLLAVRTRRHDDVPDFAAWFYQLDPAHVSFYRARTMHWLATANGWSVEFPAGDMALFRV